LLSKNISNSKLLKKNEYLKILLKKYKSPNGIDEYIKSGAESFWNRYETNTGDLRPESLADVGLDYLEKYYNKCFDTAINSCRKHEEQIDFNLFYTHSYNARIAPLADSLLIIIDSSLHSSFAVYFCCFYHLAFSDPDSSLRAKLVQMILTEFEFHLSGVNGVIYNKPFDQELWIEISSMDKDIMTWAALSTECLLIYIILHELGHVSLLHKMQSKLNQNESFKTFKCEQELEADRFASIHLYEILARPNTHGLTTDFAYVPILFFRILELVDMYKCQIMKQVSMKAENYPDFAQREKAIQSIQGASLALYTKPAEAIHYVASLILFSSNTQK